MTKEQEKLKDLLWIIYTNIANAYDLLFIEKDLINKSSEKWLDFGLRHISVILFETYQTYKSYTSENLEKNIWKVNSNWKLKFLGDTLVDNRYEETEAIIFTDVEKMEEYIVNKYLYYLCQYWLNKKESN